MVTRDLPFVMLFNAEKEDDQKPEEVATTCASTVVVIHKILDRYGRIFIVARSIF